MRLKRLNAVVWFIGEPTLGFLKVILARRYAMKSNQPTTLSILSAKTPENMSLDAYSYCMYILCIHT